MASVGELIQRWYPKIETDWSYTDTTPATTDAVINVPAEAGKKHYITTIFASFEADVQGGEVELQCGGVTTFISFIQGEPLEIEFSIPLECPENTDVNLTITNTSQSRASIFMAGYTKKVD